MTLMNYQMRLLSNNFLLLQVSVFFIILFLFFPLVISANNLSNDTTTNKSDTINITEIPKAKNEIDDIITYKATDSIVFDLINKKMYLYNEAQLIYKDLKLNSGLIIFNQDVQTLNAKGLLDSNNKYVQLPLMFQGSDKYEGFELFYNFKLQQGSISKGFSEAEVGYYFGEKIKKVTPEVYFIKDGLYTTSTDKIDPEYYFFSPKMKIIPKDKVIAQSVFLYVEGVPIFWIPFAIFPDRHGRSSGLIVPTYGNDGTYGVYFANFGYFWAINEYMDLTSKGSWFSKGRVDVNLRYRYALRYKFQGSVEGGYSLISTGEDKDLDKFTSKQWALTIVHNHKLSPTSNIDANLSFVSGKSYYDNSTNKLSDLLRQNVVSNFTFSKTWEETPFSLSLNYYRDQNLINGSVQERLPSIRFNISETAPFANKNSSGENKWYEFFSYSYTATAQNNRIKSVTPLPNGIDSVSNDSRAGILHNINLNFTPKSNFFTLRPYFYYTEIWYNRYITKEFNNTDSSLQVTDHTGLKAVRYFQMGVSLTTKLIGIFTPKLFSITGIRHTLMPSITYSYTPDFSASKWGYYSTYRDAKGNLVKYSLFEKEIFGSPPAFESQSIIFTLSNIFEMKTRTSDTSENKFQLFNFNISSAYNFAADSLKWSDIRSDFRTQIGGVLNIGGGATFSLYEFEPVSHRRINKFLLSTQGKFAELTNFNINISTTFNLNLTNKKRTEMKANRDEEAVKKLSISDTAQVYFEIPLSGGFNYNYSLNKQDPTNVFKVSTLSGNLSFSISDRWKFSIAASYDIFNKQISAPYITAYRDLKSWEINFNWYPLGIYRGFFFEVRIKAPQLHDIKITKQTNTRGVY